MKMCHNRLVVFVTNPCVLALFTKVSRYLSELEALPPQEVAPWFKALTDEWLGHIAGLFDKMSQVQRKGRFSFSFQTDHSMP